MTQKHTPQEQQIKELTSDLLKIINTNFSARDGITVSIQFEDLEKLLSDHGYTKQPLAIKPLEFKQISEYHWKAETSFGDYDIGATRINDKYFYAARWNGDYLNHPSSYTLEVEVQFANTHHRELVMKCLVPMPLRFTPQRVFTDEEIENLVIEMANQAIPMVPAPVTEQLKIFKIHYRSNFGVYSGMDSVVSANKEAALKEFWKSNNPEQLEIDRIEELPITVTEGKGWSEEEVEGFSDWTRKEGWEFFKESGNWLNVKLPFDSQTTAELFTEYQRHLQSLKQTER